MQRESHYYVQKHDVKVVQDCLELGKIDLRFKVYEYRDSSFLLIEDTLKEVCVDDLFGGDDAEKKYN